MSELGNIVAVMVGVAVEGAYSYRVPDRMQVARGSIVEVPLGPRQILGVVWGPPKDVVAHNRLRDIARQFDVPPLSGELADLIDWVARYTLAPPGMVMRAVMRSREALDPPRPIMAYRFEGAEPQRMTDARRRVLELLDDGQAWAKTALVGASGVSASVIDGLVKQGALQQVELPAPHAVLPPDADHAPIALNAAQAAALSQIRQLDVQKFGVALLDGVKVDYYGVPTPLNQVANVNVEDARTLSPSAWDKTMIPAIEKAILKSDLGLNPATNGDTIRLPMPALTAETRKDYIKQARAEAGMSHSPFNYVAKHIFTSASTM